MAKKTEDTRWVTIALRDGFRLKNFCFQDSPQIFFVHSLKIREIYNRSVKARVLVSLLGNYLHS